MVQAMKVPKAVMLDHTLISIVADDELYRDSVRKLVKLLGYTVEIFPSAADFSWHRVFWVKPPV